MPATREFVGQPLHKNIVPAIIVGWIEGRDHAEA
jgi:hypothetical protein